MADINQVITLGVGTPADVLHFLLIGLNINPDVVDYRPTTLHERSLTLELDLRSLGLTLEERSLALHLPVEVANNG